MQNKLEIHAVLTKHTSFKNGFEDTLYTSLLGLSEQILYSEWLQQKLIFLSFYRLQARPLTWPLSPNHGANMVASQWGLSSWLADSNLTVLHVAFPWSKHIERGWSAAATNEKV